MGGGLEGISNFVKCLVLYRVQCIVYLVFDLFYYIYTLSILSRVTEINLGEQNSYLYLLKIKSSDSLYYICYKTEGYSKGNGVFLIVL